jgi:hypothetical protein
MSIDFAHLSRFVLKLTSLFDNELNNPYLMLLALKSFQQSK